jgi:hypothetical protein
MVLSKTALIPFEFSRLTNQLTGDNLIMARKVFDQINVDYLAIMRRRDLHPLHNFLH